ncbi:MAG: DUF58 domain-containing protein [Pedosphaera sp.]|nr:DUF58 domain-containing protein [Pedosphaera sp.]
MAQPLLARFPMEGTVSGQHRSPHRGSSVEFAEYRNYVPGDDLRRLDWRVFARSDRFYMKEFEAETNLRCYLVFDSSASMRFIGKHGSKLDYARRMIATLAYLIVHQGDAAGLLSVGEKTVFEIPPRRNPAHLQLILEMLGKVEPIGETGLVSALHDLAEKVRRRALVIIFSDFFADPVALLNCFQHLRFQKHDLVVFHLLDRMELDFQFDRPVRFVDLESSFSLVTEPATIRDEYLQQLRAFLGRLKDGCHEFKADYRQVVTDQEYGKVLADFLVERARYAA